jgi:diguanylate cyclase (GGDEF)-like protein
MQLEEVAPFPHRDGVETVESIARKPVAAGSEEPLTLVARTAWIIYQKAADVYRVLAGGAMSEELSQLWRGMAEGLKKHVIYWERMAEHIQKDPNIEVLGNPYAAIRQLRDAEERIDRIQESCTSFRSVLEYFYLAFSLEVQLIHPVLCSLPESVMTVPDKEWVKWDYQTNLKAFLAGMRKHCESNYLHDAMTDSLERMWSQNRQAAQQASLDPVTGAYNRRSLSRIISSYSSLAERDGQNVAIILIGIENMHELYTTFDLKTADEVVLRFYNGIKPGIRLSDVMGRYSFSTFLVYLSKVNQQYLYDIAARFSEATQTIYKAGFVLSVHIGGSYGQVRNQAGLQLGTYLTRARDCLMRSRLSRTQRIIIE